MIPAQRQQDVLLKAAPFTAEFIGTFMLVAAVACCKTTAVTWASPWVAGFILMALIYALAPISGGGHFNPAVSLSWALAGKLDFVSGSFYIICQLLGAVLVGQTLVLLHPGIEDCSIHSMESACPTPTCSWDQDSAKCLQVELPGPKTGFSLSQALGVEMAYSFTLCFIFLNVCCSSRISGNQFFGLAIGIIHVAAGYATGYISGAFTNPALTLGIGIADPDAWAYAGIQLCGGALAALAFRVLRPEEYSVYTPPEYVATFAKFMSESVGTMMIVLSAGLSSSLVQSASTALPWAYGACVMGLTYAVGDISGANLNPAVTVGVMISGRNKLSLGEGFVYMVAQFVGAAIGGSAYGFYISEDAIKPSGETKDARILLELLFTSILVLIALAVMTTNTASSFHFGLSISGCLIAGCFAVAAGIASNGPYLNPAVQFGIDLGAQISGVEAVKPHWGNCLYYMLIEMLAGICGAAIFCITYRAEYVKPEYMDMDPGFGNGPAGSP